MKAILKGAEQPASTMKQRTETAPEELCRGKIDLVTIAALPKHHNCIKHPTQQDRGQSQKKHGEQPGLIGWLIFVLIGVVHGGDPFQVGECGATGGKSGGFFYVKKLKLGEIFSAMVHTIALSDDVHKGIHSLGTLANHDEPASHI